MIEAVARLLPGFMGNPESLTKSRGAFDPRINFAAQHLKMCRRIAQISS